MESERHTAHESASPCQEMRDLLLSYREGGLNDEQRATTEAHLENCPACRAYCSSLCSLPDALKRALPVPSQSLHDGVMQAVHRLPRRRPPVRAAAAFAACLCFLLIGFTLLRAGFGVRAEAEDGTIGNLTPNSPADVFDGAEDDRSSMEQSDAAEALAPSVTKDPNPGEDNEQAPTNEQMPTEDTPLALPDETTLCFTRHADGYWICGEGDDAYVLLFVDPDEVLLYHADSLAHGIYDNKGNVVLIGANAYSGYYEQPTEDTLTLYLSHTP